MRTARIFKQKMYYSLFDKEMPEYQTDMDGNILHYTDAEGNTIPLETGETTVGYDLPVEFMANISFGNGEAEAREYGLNISDYDASMVVEKGTLPITETSIIWYNEEPSYIDPDKTLVNAKSATFRVRAVKPSLQFDKYLLQRLTK